jgi:hypothetical protein
MQFENDENRPTLVGYTLDHELDELDRAGEVVVTLRFEDGSKRTMTFLVPDALLSSDDPPELLLYDCRDVVLVTRISAEVIRDVLDRIAEEGALIDCSVPWR